MILNGDTKTGQLEKDRLTPPSSPGHSDTSIQNIAVLFTDIIGSTQFFQSHGNLAGRTMLQQHESLVSTTIARFGGTVVKNLGDSIMAYFLSPREATKTAVQIQKEFQDYNKEHGDGHKIHVRIGIHFDEGIVENTDIFGNAVNIASKITDLAGSNEICISENVFALAKALPSLTFEPVKITDNDNARLESLAYRVCWEKSVGFAPALMTVLYMKPFSQKRGSGIFDPLWKSLITARALFWEGRVHSETILEDQAVILTTKNLSVAMDVVADVLTFLKESIGGQFTVPLQILVDAGPPQIIEGLIREGFKPEWDHLRPDTIFLTTAAHYLIAEEKIHVASITPPEPGTLYSFYAIAPNDYQQNGNELLFPYQGMLYKGDHAPCFYCGSRDHAISDCPSKQLTVVTDTLDHLGYLSFEEISETFLSYLKSSEEEKARTLRSDEEMNGQPPSAGLGLYELNQLFQLRFLRNIWESASNDWDTVARARQRGDGSGDLIWLAQDCIRVSNLTKAESLLRNCLEKYPDDYRTYCALAFLNIEQGKFPRSEQHLNKALRYTRTVPQKIYILFLLSRLHNLAGDFDGARRRTREISIMQPYCPEATYQEVVFNFREGREGPALKRLISLIRMNREYYVKTLIDPDLAPYSQVTHPVLKNLFTEIRQQAQRKAFEAGRKFTFFDRFWVKGEEEDAQKIKAFMSKMQSLVSTASYFGYLDIADCADSIISICRRAQIRRKERLMDSVHAVHKRIDSIFDFTADYRPQLSSTSPYRQLQAVRSQFEEFVRSAALYDLARYKEMSEQCRKMLGELTEIEVKLRQLRTILNLKRFILVFTKNAIFILSIILFAEIVILPTIAYYLNTFLPDFDLFTGGDLRVYHKYALIFGLLGGLGLTFLKSFKTFFKGKA